MDMGNSVVDKGHIVVVDMVDTVAVVFGSEESGLGNREIQACDLVSFIPMIQPYPSLNLSQAVMLYAYTLSAVPNDHSIYRSFFTIDKTIWDQYVAGARSSKLSADLSFGPYLMGIWIGNRLVGVYSDKEIGNVWQRNWRGSGENSMLRLGVNMVVFALEQEKEAGIQ